ncbi:hypothetical protein AB0J83_41955 [Actinoplanes sp. NPDC049596]|uniref:hypothetical protein n=1 Tax=unclassified Actinoplanes TaxID=2626549 RepID=UPI003441788A
MTTGGYTPDPCLPPPGGPDDGSFGDFAAQIRACLERAESVLVPIDATIGDIVPAATCLNTAAVGTDNDHLLQSAEAIATGVRLLRDAQLAVQAGIEQGNSYLGQFGC